MTGPDFNLDRADEVAKEEVARKAADAEQLAGGVVDDEPIEEVAAGAQGEDGQRTEFEKGAIARMRRQIDEARRIEEEILGIEKEYDQEDKSGLSPKFIAECFRLNERGDGLLFAKIFRDRFVFVKKVNMWLYWAGNHWRYDEDDRVIDAVDTVAVYFEEHADRLRGLRDDLLKDREKEDAAVIGEVLKKYKSRINRLRSLKGAKICAEYAHRIGDASLKIFPEDLDKQPTLMAFTNCVVDMMAGLTVPSNPQDYIVNAVDHEWQGIACPAPRWEKFFAEIHQDDPELIEFVHRMLGYSATGLRCEHFYACFIGRGRNGKGTMFDTLRYLLGDLGWIIDPGMLLEQKNSRKSAGPSPDLYSLMGRRMVIASETDEGAKVSISEVKRLSGGDWLKTRAPFDRKEINFRPTHKLLFHTNHPPEGLAKDFAIAQRLYFIEYHLSYVDYPNPAKPNERKKDKSLSDALEKEASGILAWLVRGAMKWKAEGGLNPPDQIKAAVDERRKADDNVLAFFSEAMANDDSDLTIDFSPVYDAYKAWYRENIGKGTDTYAISKIKFSKWCAENGYKPEDKKKAKIGGVAKLFGVRFKTAEELEKD